MRPVLYGCKIILIGCDGEAGEDFIGDLLKIFLNILVFKGLFRLNSDT